MSLQSKVVSAAKWSALAQIAPNCITPLIFIILANLLTPKDFGLVTIATIIISFSQIFWDAGLRDVLIQRQKDIDKVANIVFWTNSTLAMAIYVVLFFSSGLIASLFKEPLAENVIKVQGVVIFLASLSSVQTALFEKDLNFSKLFHVRLITALLPGIASIPLALHGFGYWSLVVGSIGGALFQLVVLWSASSWRPRLEYDIPLARELSGFCFWVVTESLIGRFMAWIDSIFIGIFLGSETLGVYKAGTYVVAALFGFLLSPIYPVVYSYICRIQHDPEKIKRFYIEFTKLVSFITVPAAVGLYLVSDHLALLFFNQQWEGISAVIKIFALLHVFTAFTDINPELYRATGRPDINTKIAFCMGAIYCVFWFVFYMVLNFSESMNNMNVFLCAKFLLALSTVPIHLYMVKLFWKVNMIDLFDNKIWIIVFTLLMSIWVRFYKHFSEISVASLTVIVISGILIYSLIYLVEKIFIERFWLLIRQGT